MIDDLRVHTSDALKSPAGEIFELRLKTVNGHGLMTSTHVRAVDLEQAEEIGQKYADVTGARFVGVFPFVVADASLLDSAKRVA